MPLSPGTRIGSYEVISSLGEGGMGEVYRAHDTALGRDVAIKILPEQFIADADRLARFEREARTLASLSHPNIAAIHGIEHHAPVDGAQGAVSVSRTAIVMELVSGVDVSERLRHGPLPSSEAIAIARQIAAALEAAHAQGVIHRDLKPANVKVTDDGAVKVLDFGLAKTASTETAERTGDAESAAAATMTSPAAFGWGSGRPEQSRGAMTAMGVILGTAAYMSPEQAKGRTVDKRADIWAFGCVLYEMLTGRAIFAGDSVAETIGFVATREPDWTSLPSGVPPAVIVFLKRCLAKSPKDRVQDIGDVRLALEGAFDVPVAAGVPGPPARSQRSRVLAAITAGLTLIAAGAFAAWQLKPGAELRSQPARQFIVIPAPEPLSIANINRDIAITPDGTRLVYLAGRGSERTLYVRPLDALTPTALRRGDRFFDPFVSPNNKWVGFNDESNFTLRKIPLAGGPPVDIAEVGREIAGATWGPDGAIVFAYSGLGSGLMRIPNGNASAAVLTTPDTARGEVGHYWPELLPGGRALIYTARAGEQGARYSVWALDLQSGAARRLVETGTGARYSASGHLLYGAENALFAIQFDAATLETRGDPVRLLDEVRTKDSGAVNVSMSDDGTLAYIGGAAAYTPRRLVWIDRASGVREPVSGLLPSAYTTARFSPDGSRVALDIRGDDADVWIWNLASNVSTKITNNPGADATPSWTSDSARIVFQSQRDGLTNIFVQSADGTGPVGQLTHGTNTKYPSAVGRDGSIFYWEVGPRVLWDVFMLPAVAPNQLPVPLLNSAAVERNPEPSPDGKWLAYGSSENQAGLQEVYVRPFPNVAAGRVQISTGGGMYPMWLPRSGSELFYVRPDGRLMAVPMRGGTPSGPARVVVDGGFYTAPNPRSFDLSPDGKRLLMIEELPGAAPAGVVIVLNWADELKRRLPIR